VRKVVVSEFVSLDGVMEDPGWTFRFSSEEQEQYKSAELAAGDALLLGRVTYEGLRREDLSGVLAPFRLAYDLAADNADDGTPQRD